MDATRAVPFARLSTLAAWMFGRRIMHLYDGGAPRLHDTLIAGFRARGGGA
jgi:hypothetical protein